MTEHECVFVEEQEPSGRLILPPCIVCGLTAMDTLEQLRDRAETAEAKVRRVEALADEAEAWDLGEVKPERMVFADDLRAALSDDRGDA